MIEVYAVNCMEGLSKSQFEELLSVVDKKKRTRIEKFVKFEDAQRTLIADVLTRLMLCTKFDLRADYIEFYYNDYGKPYLKGHNSIHFNASHSKDWIVCAVGDKPLGVDIQHISPIDSRIAEVFFSVEENKNLEYTPADKKLEYFYDLWTLKESYVKAIGKGLSIPLDSFSILKHEACIFLKSTIDNNGYYFRQYDIDRNYKLSVCGSDSTFSDIKVYNCNQIYKLYAYNGGY